MVEREILLPLRRLNKNELDEAMTQLREMRKEGVAFEGVVQRMTEQVEPKRKPVMEINAVSGRKVEIEK